MLWMGRLDDWIFGRFALDCWIDLISFAFSKELNPKIQLIQKSKNQPKFRTFVQ